MLYLLTLNWQGKNKLIRLKNSLLPALENVDFKWLIKDNASTDGSIEEIKSWNNQNIIPISYPHNRDSYAQGMNFLFKEAASKSNDLILTLNNDIQFNDRTSLKNMINIIEKDPSVGQVGAKLNYFDTDKIQHAGVLCSMSSRGLPYHFRLNQKEEDRDRQNRIFPAVTGAVALMKSDVFENCFTNKSGNKGFCEDYIWAFEDIDMSFRIKYLLGKKIVNCGQTNIYHEESGSLKVNPVNKLFMNHNIKTFITHWHKHIDVKEAEKYQDPKYNLYK